jgi:hypothetical protein
MRDSAGIALSRVCAIPASMDEGCPWMVVLRAYMICLLCVGQRLDGAAVHFIVLPQARRGNGRAGVSRMAIRGCRWLCDRLPPGFEEADVFRPAVDNAARPGLCRVFAGRMVRSSQ